MMEDNVRSQAGGSEFGASTGQPDGQHELGPSPQSHKGTHPDTFHIGKIANPLTQPLTTPQSRGRQATESVSEVFAAPGGEVVPGSQSAAPGAALPSNLSTASSAAPHEQAGVNHPASASTNHQTFVSQEPQMTAASGSPSPVSGGQQPHVLRGQQAPISHGQGSVTHGQQSSAMVNHQTSASPQVNPHVAASPQVNPQGYPGQRVLDSSAVAPNIDQGVLQSVTASAAAQQPIVLQLPPQKTSKAPWVLLGIALMIILLMVGSCVAIPFSLIHSVSSIDTTSLNSLSSGYPSATHPHTVAIIHWDEGISARSGVNPEQVRNQLISAEQDDNIDAILIRCNCPGGTVAASEEIAVYISQCTKPVVFSVSDLCASGAYMGASQADAIVAMPTSEVGSIGVIMSHTDLTGLMEKLGIKIDPIKSDQAKDAGAYYREMTPEERAKFEAEIADCHDKFIKIVAQGRGLPEDQVRSIATGEVFAGDKALELGLIDCLGTLDDALDVVATLTNNNYEDLELLDYDPQPSFGSMLGIPQLRYPASLFEGLLLEEVEGSHNDAQPHPSARAYAR